MWDKLEGFKNFLTEKRQLKENSVISYARDLSSFFEYLQKEGFKSLKGVNQTAIMAYLMYMSNRGSSAASISRALAAIRIYFVYMIDEGEIKENPARDIKAPKAERTNRALVSTEEVIRLFEAIPLSARGIRDRIMLELVCYVGIRASAATELKTDDVCLDCKAIKLGNETVMLSMNISKALKAYMSDTRNSILGGRESVYLFPCVNGEKMTRQGFWKNIKKYAALVGLEKKLSPRSLRGITAEK